MQAPCSQLTPRERSALLRSLHAGEPLVLCPCQRLYTWMGYDGMYAGIIMVQVCMVASSWYTLLGSAHELAQLRATPGKGKKIFAGMGADSRHGFGSINHDTCFTPSSDQGTHDALRCTQ